MTEDKYQIELQQAYSEFIIKVEEAKENYQQKIDEILENIDELKLAQVKKNLNI